MGSINDHIPDFLLERYALRELSPAQMARLEGVILTDPDLASRVDALDASNREILRAYPPEEFARLVELKYRRAIVSAEKNAREGRRSSQRRLLMFAPAFAAALILLIILTQSNETPEFGGSPVQKVQYTREKGLEPHLRIFRKVGNDAELLTGDSIVQSGDVLQIGYVAHGEPFGVILSIDGRGVVTLHYPEDPTLSTRLEQDGEVHVPHAYEIDDAPDFERFFLITAAAPIVVDSVLTAAQRLAQNPERAAVDTLVLAKGQNQNATRIRKQEAQR